MMDWRSLLPRRRVIPAEVPVPPVGDSRFPTNLFHDYDPRNPHKPLVTPRGEALGFLGRKSTIPPSLGRAQQLIPHPGIALPDSTPVTIQPPHGSRTGSH